MPHSGQDYVKAAKKNDLVVKQGKGDHVLIHGPANRGYMVVPLHKELATGTDHSISKWFKALGIMVGAALAIIVAISATSGGLSTLLH